MYSDLPEDKEFVKQCIYEMTLKKPNYNDKNRPADMAKIKNPKRDGFNAFIRIAQKDFFHPDDPRQTGNRIDTKTKHSFYISFFFFR